MAHPLRVGLDMRMERASGIGTYVRALSEQLATHPDVTLVPLRSRTPPYSLVEQLAMPRHTIGVDLVHCPQYNVPLATPRPLVVTIHDLAHLALPYYRRLDMRLYANVMLRTASAKARLVITDSAFTRDELQRHVGLDPARVRVIPCGVSPDFSPDPDPVASAALVRAAGITEPFVLHVGVVKPHKNLSTLVEAFARLGDRPEHLVLAGRMEDLRVAEDDLEALVARSPAHPPRPVPPRSGRGRTQPLRGLRPPRARGHGLRHRGRVLDRRLPPRGRRRRRRDGGRARAPPPGTDPRAGARRR